MTTKVKVKRYRVRSGARDKDRPEDLSADWPENWGQQEAEQAPEGAGESAPMAARRARRQARMAAAAGQTDATSHPQAAPQAPAAAAAHPAGQAHDHTAGSTPPPPDAAPQTPTDAGKAETVENLSARQLRSLRRTAQKHGIDSEDDSEALRELRARGIDPFARTSPLEPDALDGRSKSGRIQLPQTNRDMTPGHEPGVAGQFTSSERRQREIMNIQHDIARRRRRKMLQLFTRLAFFILLPTVLAGYYYYAVATPMYSTKSEFLILQADGSGSGPASSLFSGTQFATNQDSIAVQSFLASKDAMLRLDEDLGFRSHFMGSDIDPIQRLPEDASIEQTYGVYQKYVKIGYDPTEGVVRMETIAASPLVSASFSSRLIDYAEERVDELTRRKRDDAMGAAREGLARARAERVAAQRRLVAVQEGAVVDPEAIIGSLRTQISSFEIELRQKELELAALQDNLRPNQARVDGVTGEIRRLRALIADLNRQMTAAQADGESLAARTAEVQMAQADLVTADMFLQAALETAQAAEQEASKQVRYLTTSVRPVVSEDPSYPRAFENTLLVFLILSGAYLLISLTGAILREQVSN